jgi:uncharacterized protein YecE (DUF72 family)
MEGPKNLKIGCCGFRVPMAQYVERFEVVEVQQTFYQPPQLSTLEKWREAAPVDFEFTVKAWQLITHEYPSPTYRRLKRELKDKEKEQVGAFRWNPIVREGWKTTLECARALRANRILFQCPAKFKATVQNVKNLEKFLDSVGNRDGLIFLWEPRGSDWSPDLIRRLCAEHDLVHVVDPLAARTVTPDRIYYRLHGRRVYNRDYEDEELSELYDMIPAEPRSYVLFNNVRMVPDAQRFIEIASRG